MLTPEEINKKTEDDSLSLPPLSSWIHLPSLTTLSSESAPSIASNTAASKTTIVSELNFIGFARNVLERIHRYLDNLKVKTPNVLEIFHGIIILFNIDERLKGKDKVGLVEVL